LILCLSKRDRLLKISPRNSSETPSVILVSFEPENSQLSMPWPRRVGSFRLSFPKPKADGAEKQLVLNHSEILETAEPPMLFLQSAITLVRGVPAPKDDSRVVGIAYVITNGKPLENTVIPSRLHPEMILEVIPLTLLNHRLFCPNGKPSRATISSRRNTDDETDAHDFRFCTCRNLTFFIPRIFPDEPLKLYAVDESTSRRQTRIDHIRRIQRNSYMERHRRRKHNYH
jgi:hypothetical protein